MSTDNCALVGGNTGAADCGWKRGVPKVPVVGGKTFSSTEYADEDSLTEALLEALALPTGDPEKLFPFPVVGKVAKTTEADTFGGLTLGPQRRLRKGKPSYTYTVEVSQEEYLKLLAFDGKTVKMFHFDDRNQFIGRRDRATANTPNTNDFTGEQVYVTISGNGFEDGENAETGAVTISMTWLNADDFDKRVAKIDLPNLSSGDLKGLQDVRISQPSAHVSNVYKLRFDIVQDSQLNGDLNIFDEHGAALAGLVADFGLKSGASFGTDVSITSLAVDNTNKCLTLTVDSTDFGALSSGDKMKLIPPTTTQLDAAGIKGLEIGTIILTK